MKTILICLFGILVTCGTVCAKSLETIPDIHTVTHQQRLFENQINESINSIVEKIRPFDPLSQEHLALKIFGHSILIENWYWGGFSNIVASHINFSIFWLTLDLVLEMGHMSEYATHWKVDGNIIYGDGDFKFSIEGAELAISVGVSIFPPGIESLHVAPFIDQAEVSITGIYNNEELSQNISDQAAWLLNEYISNNPEFHNLISKILLKMIQCIIGS